MICTFVFIDTPAYEYDVKGALANHATVFMMDIARLDGDSLVGKQFAFELLDNEKWETKTKQRTTLEINTRQNLLLHGFVLTTGPNKGKTLNFRTLLESWYYARSRWFYPDAIQFVGATIKPENLLVKYVRGQDSLAFTQGGTNNRTSFLLSAVVKLETANSQ